MRIVRALLSATAAAVVVACGGGGDGGTNPPPTPVFTSVGVTPATATIVAGATQPLTVVARDQNGAAMAGTPSITYSSSDQAKATVSLDGVVTGVAAGDATITAQRSLPPGGSVKGSAAVEVQ